VSPDPAWWDLSDDELNDMPLVDLEARCDLAIREAEDARTLANELATVEGVSQGPLLGAGYATAADRARKADERASRIRAAYLRRRESV
jgi:hypothetical protein